MKQYTQKQIRFITECFQNGQKSIQSGNLIQAEKYYLDILKIDSKIIEACNALAFIYTTTHQHTKAVDQLKKILSTNPNDSNVHHNLANNLSDLEQYNEAIKHYQIAIKLNPNYVDSYIQCGFAYLKLKDNQSALEYLQRSLQLDKDNAKALHLIGTIHAEMGNYESAIPAFSQAISLSPSNREYHLYYALALENANLLHEADIQYHHICNTFPDYLEAFLAYGDLLTKNRYFDQALECFKHAAKLAPDNVDILDDIGATYLELSDTFAAIDTFNQALAKQPHRITSLTGIYNAYREAGQLTEAINICDQIIDWDNTNPLGYTLKARVKKSVIGDPIANELVKLANHQDLSEDVKTDLYFTLGKIYDDQNLYKQAFEYYNKGNTLINQKIHYDKSSIEDLFNSLIEVFNQQFFKQHEHLGNASSLPIVIVGMPRSGTTLTEQIISSHPEVLAAGEVVFWGNMVKKLHYLDDVKLDYPSCLNHTLPSQAIDISKNYLSVLAKISGSKGNVKHITDKMPQNFLYLGLIALLFPNVKIIHTKRNPIDTCLSIYFQNFKDSHPYAFDIENLGHYYAQYQRLMNHWHLTLPNRIMDLQYSDTVSNPEYWSRKLIAHIGLDWDDACLSPHKLERTVKTASHWQVRQPIYQTSVQRWKNYEQYLHTLIDALGID